MEDIRGDENGDAGDEGIEHRLSCGNLDPVLRQTIGNPADQKFRKRDKQGRETLKHAIIQQSGNILICENMSSMDVGEHTA